MININAQIIFFSEQKLIAITIVFHKLYQCGCLMSEITLNIILPDYNSNRLLRLFIAMINIIAQIIFFPLQKLIAITIVFHNHANVPLCQKLLET